MRRANSQGILREDLLWCLQDGQPVRRAVKEDRCLLCRSEGVNDAGLCEGCNANLTDEEWAAAAAWIEGKR
ncbi:MAG: hypothetical protein C4340_06815 [Armatimonadota bacterium]